MYTLVVKISSFEALIYRLGYVQNEIGCEQNETEVINKNLSKEEYLHK